MAMANPVWGDWYNAAVYDAYVREYPIYQRLNRRLIELADIGGAARVLDLACGSGATAAICLEVLPAAGELIGVDGSRPMVEMARARIHDPRARFVVGEAAEVAETVAGPFDRVVCNAAFWQLPKRDVVLQGLARLLAPGGLFVFNLPAARVAGEASEVHPFQVALHRALADAVDGGGPVGPPLVEPLRLERRLKEAGLELVTTERFVYRGRQGELVELMKIPAMIAGAAPELAPAGRVEALERAAGRVDPQQEIEVPWIYYGARRR